MMRCSIALATAAARILAVAVMLMTAACSATPTPRTSPVPTTLDQQLIAAAWENDVAEAGRLITAGADVNAVDDSEQSDVGEQ